MSDYKSGLPIRSEKDGLDERVHIKIVDYAAPDTSDNQVQVSEKLLHVRNFGQDPAATKVALLLSEEGFANTNGLYHVDDNSRPASSALIAHTRDAAKDETHQVKRVSAIDSSVDADVTALDVAIRDESGNPYTANNPLPVTFEESEGDEIIDFKASAADILKDATDTHVYTVPTGKVFQLMQVMCTSSGRAKFDIKTGPVGTLVQCGVRMTSTAQQDSDWNLQKPPLKVVAGDVVQITRTNRDNQALSLYTTIVGVLKNA